LTIARAAVFRLICSGWMLVLVGCSSSPPRPAPVTGVDFYSKYQKGSYSGTTYKVSRGETLYAISWRTGVSVETLTRLNHIDTGYTIYPGQQLLLRQPVNTSVPASRPRPSNKHGVKPGQPAGHNTMKRNPLPARATSPKTATDKTASVAKEKTVAPVSRKEYADNAAQKVNSSALPERIHRWLWPTQGTVVKGFSATEQGNKGIDIAGRAGQPIYATADGKVVYAGNALRGYGNLVIVKHNDEYLSAYAHNQNILVREQQSIKAGQQIATMGRSGAADVRLHFEIRLRGKSVNPLRYLPKQ